MMHICLARHQRVDHLEAEPAAERAHIAVGDDRDAAGRHRLEPLGRRQPHQHLPAVDRGCAFDAVAVAVEQQREIVEAERIGKAERGALAARHQIGGAIAQDHVLLAKAQMGEKIFDVGDLLERPQHDDDVRLARGLGREIAAGDIAGLAAVAGDAVAALVAAAARQKALERAIDAEIEHARAGRDELRGEFGPRVARGTRREVSRRIQREVEIDLKIHFRRTVSRCRTRAQPANHLTYRIIAASRGQ